MNLVDTYLDICRHDPSRAEIMTKIIKEEIQNIVDAYTANLQLSYQLIADMKRIVQNYLIKQSLYDLYSV